MNRFELDAIDYILPSDIDEKYRAWIAKTRADLLFSMSWPEIKCGVRLMERGIEFVAQAPVIVNEQLYFVDFFIPATGVVIEMNSTWKLTGDQESSYAEKDAALASYGLTVVRVGYDGVTRELLNDLFGPMSGRPRRWKSHSVIVTHDSSTGEARLIKEMEEEKDEPKPKGKKRGRKPKAKKEDVTEMPQADYDDLF